MKRVMCLLSILVLLTGCTATANPGETSAVPTTSAPTFEPTQPTERPFPFSPLDYHTPLETTWESDSVLSQLPPLQLNWYTETSSKDSEVSRNIMAHDCDAQEVLDYIQTLLDAGFTKNSRQDYIHGEKIYVFGGRNERNVTVRVMLTEIRSLDLGTKYEVQVQVSCMPALTPPEGLPASPDWESYNLPAYVPQPQVPSWKEIPGSNSSARCFQLPYATVDQAVEYMQDLLDAGFVHKQVQEYRMQGFSFSAVHESGLMALVECWANGVDITFQPEANRGMDSWQNALKNLLPEPETDWRRLYQYGLKEIHLLDMDYRDALQYYQTIRDYTKAQGYRLEDVPSVSYQEDSNEKMQKLFQVGAAGQTQSFYLVYDPTADCPCKLYY